MCYTKPRTAKNIIGIHEALSTPSDKFMKYLSCKSIFLLLSGYDLLVKMSYLMKIKRKKKKKERKNEKLTDIQNKFDILASDNEMLQSKIVVAKKTTRTLQENLNSNNSKITELERFTNWNNTLAENVLKLLEYLGIFLMLFLKMLSTN